MHSRSGKVIDFSALTIFISESTVLDLWANIWQVWHQDAPRMLHLVETTQYDEDLKVIPTDKPAENICQVMNRHYKGIDLEDSRNHAIKKEVNKNATKTARDWQTTLARIQQAIKDDGPEDGQKFEVGKCYKIDGKDENGSYATKRHYSFWIEKTAQDVYRVAIIGLNTAIYGEDEFDTGEPGIDDNMWSVGSFKKGKKHSVYCEVKHGIVDLNSIQEAILLKEKSEHKGNEEVLQKMSKHIENARRIEDLLQARLSSLSARSENVVVKPMFLAARKAGGVGQIIYVGKREMLDQIIKSGRKLSPRKKNFVIGRMIENIMCLRGGIASDSNLYHGDIKPENFVGIYDREGRLQEVRITDCDGMREQRGEDENDIGDPRYMPSCLSRKGYACLSRDMYAVMWSAIQVAVEDADFGFGKRDGDIQGFDEETVSAWFGLLSTVNDIIARNHDNGTKDEEASQWMLNLTQYLTEYVPLVGGEAVVEKELGDQAVQLLDGDPDAGSKAGKLLQDIKQVKQVISAAKGAAAEDEYSDEEPVLEEEAEPQTIKLPQKQSSNYSISPVTIAVSGVILSGVGAAMEVWKKLNTKLNVAGFNTTSGAILVLLGVVCEIVAVGMALKQTCCNSNSASHKPSAPHDRHRSSR